LPDLIFQIGAIFVGFLKNMKFFVIFPKLSEVNPEDSRGIWGWSGKISEENGDEIPRFSGIPTFLAQNGHFPEPKADKSGNFWKFRGVDSERSRSEKPEDSITASNPTG
jgi:hypothetical protein